MPERFIRKIKWYLQVKYEVLGSDIVLVMAVFATCLFVLAEIPIGKPQVETVKIAKVVSHWNIGLPEEGNSFSILSENKEALCLDKSGKYVLVQLPLIASAKVGRMIKISIQKKLLSPPDIIYQVFNK